MKPTIPDTGMVIRLEGEYAEIRMKHEGSCYKCGAAAIGLCRGGMMQMVIAKNTARARVGDNVKIALVPGVQYQSYFLGFVVPAAALFLGVVAGRSLGDLAGIAALDVITGFSSMFVASFISLRRLKRLASVASIEVAKVLPGALDPALPGPDEKTTEDFFASSY